VAYSFLSPSRSVRILGCSTLGRCRRCQSDVWQAFDLLGSGTEDVCRDLAEVPELGIDDRHGLLAEAAKGLAVLLGEPAALWKSLLQLATLTAQSTPEASRPGTTNNGGRVYAE
jgi:hypothetical protein